jgi:hypothetical protein
MAGSADIWSAPGERLWLIDRESSSAENAVSAPIAELPGADSMSALPVRNGAPPRLIGMKSVHENHAVHGDVNSRSTVNTSKGAQPSNHKATHCAAQSAGDPAAWKCDGHCLTALVLRPASGRLSSLRLVPLTTPISNIKLSLIVTPAAAG